MIPPILLNLSKLLTAYLLSSPHLHGNVYNQIQWRVTPKLQHWIYDLTKELNTLIRTNSEPQNSAVKDPSIPVQPLSKSKKCKWKANKWKIILYCQFVLIIFAIFHIHQNLRQHATMLLTRNWTKCKRALIIKASIVAYHHHLPSPSHHQHHMIDDGHHNTFA